MQYEIMIPSWAKYIISDFTDLERKPRKVNSAKVNKIKLNLPDDVYFTYGFLDENKQLRSDPNNNNLADTPNYPELSVIMGKKYQPDFYYEPTAAADGRALRHRMASKYMQENRRIIVYTPFGFENEDLPVVYVHDGVAYYRIARLANMLEQILIENIIRPTHLVFIEPKTRLKEYGYNNNYQNFILKELIPFIDSELNTTDERITMGASLGGLVSAVLALENPEVFKTVVAQSGAFIGNPKEKNFYNGQGSWVLEQINSKKTSIRWYTEVGNLEWLSSINETISQKLFEKGYEHEFNQRNIGHNWINWRNGLAQAIKFALNI